MTVERRTGALLLFVLLLLSGIPPARAQTHLAIGLDTSTYTLLELLELKGMLSRLSAMRPYPASAVVRDTSNRQAGTPTASPLVNERSCRQSSRP